MLKLEAGIAMAPITPDDVDAITDLLRHHLGVFEDVGSVLAAAFRRIDRIYQTYNHEAAAYFVARDAEADRIIGGAGLGPLAGLPASEGIGEIRELVVDEEYRGRGIAKCLIAECLSEARLIGYKRIYLETTPQMLHAQKLFQKFGFRAVTSGPGFGQSANSDDLPSYFLLEEN